MLSAGLQTMVPVWTRWRSGPGSGLLRRDSGFPRLGSGLPASRMVHTSMSSVDSANLATKRRAIRYGCAMLRAVEWLDGSAALSAGASRGQRGGSVERSCLYFWRLPDPELDWRES